MGTFNDPPKTKLTQTERITISVSDSPTRDC